MLGEEDIPFTREHMKGIVDFARAFTERVAPKLKLTPIEVEAR